MMRKSIATPTMFILAFCIFVSFLSQTSVAGARIGNVLEKGDINNALTIENRIDTNGNGSPMVIQISISGKKKPTKWRIEKALKAALANKRYPSFKGLNTGKILYKTKMYWNKNRKVWVVKFFLKEEVGIF